MRAGPNAALAFVLLTGAGAARAQTCAELWQGRNAIYKAAGYCFKTGRAIAAFGNAGCQYDDIRDVPLSARDRALVDRYRGAETARGCEP